MGLFGQFALALLLLSPAVIAGDVTGHISITKRLTRRPVEPAAITYHRGAAVPPASEPVDFMTAELGRVAIYVEDLSGGPRPRLTVEMKQQNRRFVPEVIIVPVGSTVSFPNLDPLFHNVFSLSKARSFDLGNYPKNHTRMVRFDKPGIVPVFCHFHPKMTAAVVVTPSSWATTPGPEGEFSLTGLPAGEHTIVAWHRSAGYIRKTVIVPPSGQTTVDFAIPVDTVDSK